MIESEHKSYHIACGDWNIRVHGRLDTEEDVLGPFVYGRGATFVNNLPREDKDHRNLFIACLKSSEHTLRNSYFQKDDDKNVTS